MPYNSLTNRTDSAALIPEEVSNAMLGKATETSAVLQLFKRIPVGRAQLRLPVLSALPTAYFVSGDTGLKQTTEMSWANKYLNIEEIATIMPVPDNVLADVDANIWDEAMPLLTEAFGRTLDAAVFFGTNAPSSWPTNIASAATSAGNNVTESSTATSGAFFGSIDDAYEKVEADGYEVNGFVGSTAVKSKLRKARDSQGRKLDESRVAGNLMTIDGYPIVYPMRGMFATGSGSPRLFAGDWSQFVVGVRQDITMKILTEAVIQDNTGAIVYNLAQQDMTAIRLTFRVGWQVANTINNDQPVEASRYPVARIDIP
ncbi:phage major capsid protein [Microbispora sp. ATCC PTA-5024]|uniref:phage major capsid protein n=1 Tax=Microbispora sp. ATCC PTA-5024 TaxID=316330 RepID=UPI0003DCDCCD|nr:phage major capsid protein [Microbispora sp. ATCC PTA-5024]ETK36133.1 major capsid subunit gp9 [Microbispora sp. ATCC PTA-5024]